MQHFLDISQLDRTTIESLLEKALAFKQQKHNYPVHSQQRVANLFYENSTRTRVSFEIAANRLSMPVINLDLHSSSEAKGETIADTIRTLAAMDINYFVIRHKQNGLQQGLADFFGNQIHIINAGDGSHAHPSQAILDMLTIMEHKPKFAALKVAIVGDIKHSRVANSFQHIAAALGIGDLQLISPESWKPQVVHYGQASSNLKEGLKNADVVMCLRVQRERLLDNEQLDLDSYRRDFALTNTSLAYAKPNAIVMHPGPMNRGVEIDGEVADGPQSVILQQVNNGVYARMAIFDHLVQG